MKSVFVCSTIHHKGYCLESNYTDLYDDFFIIYLMSIAFCFKTRQKAVISEIYWPQKIATVGPSSWHLGQG